MKKVIVGALILLSISFVACAKTNEVEKTAENTAVVEETKKEKNKAEKNFDYVKKFYTEYLMAQDKMGENYTTIINNIKKKYLKDVLVEEMEFRGRFLGADPYLLTQDATGMLENMKVAMGKNDEWIVVTFNSENEFGSSEKKIDVHVNDADGNLYIDAINTYHKEVDKDGKVIVEDTKITKYADHELTEEDKKDIEASREYFKKCDEEGFIS